MVQKAKSFYRVYLALNVVKKKEMMIAKTIKSIPSVIFFIKNVTMVLKFYYDEVIGIG